MNTSTMSRRASLGAMVLVAIACSTTVSANDDTAGIPGTPEEQYEVSLTLGSPKAMQKADGQWVVQINITNHVIIKGMSFQMFYNESREQVALDGITRGVGLVEKHQFSTTCNNSRGLFATIGDDSRILKTHEVPVLLVEIILDQKAVNSSGNICFNFLGVADNDKNEIPHDSLQYPKCSCISEACGVGTFEELLNSAANAITFPDWVFDPNGYSGMNSSIDSMISDNRYILFTPMKKKNFSDNDVVGNHIAVGSYLQVIQWIFFGSAKVDTISRSVQLDLHVNKSSTSGVVDGMEYDDVWRTSTGFLVPIDREIILAQNKYEPDIIPSRSIPYLTKAMRMETFWSILELSGIAKEWEIYDTPTIFAPSDNAFENMIKNTSNGISSISQLFNLDRKTLRALAQSHIVNYTLKSTDIYKNRKDISVNGMPIEFGIKSFQGGEKIVKMQANGNVACIFEFDHKTYDGIIHEIDSVLWRPDGNLSNGDTEFKTHGDAAFSIQNSERLNSNINVVNISYSSSVDIYMFAIEIDVIMKSSSPTEQYTLSLTKAMGGIDLDARLFKNDNVVMGFSNGSSSIPASPDEEKTLFTLQINSTIYRAIENACLCINATRTSAFYWGENGIKNFINISVDSRSDCRMLKNPPPNSHPMPDISPSTPYNPHTESTPSPGKPPSSPSPKDDPNEDKDHQKHEPAASQPYKDLFVVTVVMLAVLTVMAAIALSLRWRMHNTRKSIYKAILMRERGLDSDDDIS